MSRACVDVSIVLVNYNAAHLLDALRRSIEAAAQHLRLQVIVIDNASADASPDWLRANAGGWQVIYNRHNVGFGRANNQAVALARGRYVLLLNTDAFMAPDTLHKTVAWLDANPGCGVLGVKLVGRDGSLQPSCRYLPTPLNLFLSRCGLAALLPWVRPVDDMRWDHASVRDCDWVPGCYYLMPRAVVRSVGLFDPRYFLYYEEVDHCRRVADAGWRIVYYPDTEVVHLGGESAQSAGALSGARQLPWLQIESELLYLRKCHGRSGLFAHLLLVALGDAVLAAKELLKRALQRPSHGADRRFAATLQLARRTRWGRLPLH